MFVHSLKKVNLVIGQLMVTLPAKRGIKRAESDLLEHWHIPSMPRQPSSSAGSLPKRAPQKHSL